MSVLIKGMKMPRDCIECRFFELSDEYCYARGAYGSEWGKSTGCPLVPVPPHGRLIDADAYLEKLMDTVNECVKKGVEIEAFRSFIEGAEVALVDAMTMLNNMPTIIEAEVKE